MVHLVSRAPPNYHDVVSDEWEGWQTWCLLDVDHVIGPQAGWLLHHPVWDVEAAASALCCWHGLGTDTWNLRLLEALVRCDLYGLGADTLTLTHHGIVTRGGLVLCSWCWLCRCTEHVQCLLCDGPCNALTSRPKLLDTFRGSWCAA